MALPDIAAFTRLLGVNILRRSPERSEAELPVRAELCNRRGVLHGGAVMALGDTLGGMTASTRLPVLWPMSAACRPGSSCPLNSVGLPEAYVERTSFCVVPFQS